MKRISKNIAMVLLVVLMAIALIGCQSTAPTTENAAAAAKPTASTSASAAQPSSSSASSASAALAAGPYLGPGPAVEPEAVEYPYGVTMIEKNNEGPKDFELVVVHTNDVHARIEPADGGMGYAKLGTLLKMLDTTTGNLLVFDAGDVLHGTNLANLFEGETVYELLSIMGYDAVAPGNHDFNYGQEVLFSLAARAEAESDMKFLSANILDEDGYLLFQPYQLYDFNGFVVGVIGLTTPDTVTKAHPKHVAGLSFMSDLVIDNAQYMVDELREVADFVIVLGHIGMVDDGEFGVTSQFICENIEGIDLFIDGHSHTTLPNGAVVNGTTIVSTGEYLKNLGIVTISVENGKAASISPMLLTAAEVADPSTSPFLQGLGITTVPDDPRVTSYVAEAQSQMNDMLNDVVAYLPMKLDGEREDVRTRPTNLSRLLCASMTEATGADFTITNGGNIRASIEAGPVTLGQIINVLPFVNVVTVVEMTGDDIYTALEHGYSYLPSPTGGFAQTDLQVVYNKFAAPGKRILRVLLPDGTAIDRNATYKCATNDFLAAGGDGYSSFGRIVMEDRLMSEVFTEYLMKLYPAR